MPGTVLFHMCCSPDPGPSPWRWVYSHLKGNSGEVIAQCYLGRRWRDLLPSRSCFESLYFKTSQQQGRVLLLVGEGRRADRMDLSPSL